jgi:hypothetical protein
MLKVDASCLGIDSKVAQNTIEVIQSQFRTAFLTLLIKLKKTTTGMTLTENIGEAS